MWVGKLVARWRAGGWDAVEKKSTRPGSNPNTTDDDTVARIVALRRELTAARLDAGPHALHAHLQHHGMPTPSVTTIGRILTREGPVTAEPRKRPKLRDRTCHLIVQQTRVTRHRAVSESTELGSPPRSVPRPMFAATPWGPPGYLSPDSIGIWATQPRPASTLLDMINRTPIVIPCLFKHKRPSST